MIFLFVFIKKYKLYSRKGYFILSILELKKSYGEGDLVPIGDKNLEPVGKWWI